jgi:hypothetical protein
MSSPSTDQLLASAIQFLIDGGEEKPAKALLACSTIHLLYTGKYNTELTLILTAPRALYHFLNRGIIDYDFIHEPEDDEEREARDVVSAIQRAVTAVLAPNVYLRGIEVRYALVEINPEWREELLAMLSGTHISNQAQEISKDRPIYTWNNLRFRSQTEIRIAEAFERKKVLFLPNCVARLGFRERQNRESDFLVCCEGKWGILQIDGEAFHPPTRTTEDHERGRIFLAHGVSMVQHFDAGECWENADGVVAKFLYLLRNHK